MAEIEFGRLKTLSVRDASRADNASHEIFRSEEHTSELQSRRNLVCRPLHEKKKKNKQT